jgi:hypothetical protein
MADGNDIIARWYEEALCEDNPLCAAEMDAKRRGTWFFQMTIVQDGAAGKSVSGTFEVLEFAPTLKDLEIFEEDEDHQNQWRAASIFTKLDLIKKSEAMAFVKMRDAFSTNFALALQDKKAFSRFKLSLKKFSPNGGVLYKFDLSMQSVFVLEVRKAGVAERILITYRDPNLGSEIPRTEETELEQLRRVMRGR